MNTMGITPEVASTISGAVVGLGGLFVGVVALLLNYKERKSSLRQLVYERQIDACLSLSKDLAPLHRVTWYIACDRVQGRACDPKLKGAFETYFAFAESFTIISFMLPPPVVAALTDYVAVVQRVLTEAAQAFQGQPRGSGTISGAGQEKAVDPQDVTLAYARVATALHVGLQIGEMQESRYHAIGVAPPDYQAMKELQGNL